MQNIVLHTFKPYCVFVHFSALKGSRYSCTRFSFDLYIYQNENMTLASIEVTQNVPSL